MKVAGADCLFLISDARTVMATSRPSSLILKLVDGGFTNKQTNKQINTNTNKQVSLQEGGRATVWDSLYVITWVFSTNLVRD